MVWLDFRVIVNYAAWCFVEKGVHGTPNGVFLKQRWRTRSKFCHQKDSASWWPGHEPIFSPNIELECHISAQHPRLAQTYVAALFPLPSFGKYFPLCSKFPNFPAILKSSKRAVKKTTHWIFAPRDMTHSFAPPSLKSREVMIAMETKADFKAMIP